MSDWRDDDFVDDDWVPRPAGEGVRVVGDQGHEFARPPEAPPPAAAPGRRPAGRFPLPGEGAGNENEFWGDEAPPPRRRGHDETPVELPHWTEPATGQVPRVLGGGDADDDFGPWAQVSGRAGPRYRTGGADWAGGDWAEGELFKDETTGMGALADSHDMGDVAPRKRGRRGRRGRRPERDFEHDMPSQAPGTLEGSAPAGPHDGFHGGYAEGYETGYDYESYEKDGPARAEVGPRLITGVIMAAVCLGAFAAGRVPAMLLVTAIVGAGAFELYTAFQRAGYHPATLLGLVGCAMVVPLAFEQGPSGILIGALLMGAFTLIWYLFQVVHARATVNIGLSLIPFAWVGIFGAYAGMLLSNDPGGTGLVLGVAICAVGFDVVAYFIGRSMGRTPLLPRVSPNKTVEGLVAGAIAAIALGGVVGSTLHPWADKGIGAGIVLGILVAITAPLGDLAESMIKRDLGVKDLGGILPGHGGFLDRFDAILFTLPAAFYWAVHLAPFGS
ncbi:MAG: phosphatidate cytidylyltransferase [Actinobacteria bacterium]|nr:phosphatidate cytidylyltransferase [Actinomycetota bacterium]